MKIISETKWKVGDRLKHIWYWKGAPHTYVMEVARVEDRGIVCDLLLPRGDGTWRNNGHRSLYEWHEEGEKV